MTNRPRLIGNVFPLLLASIAGMALLTGCTPRPPASSPSPPQAGWHIDLTRFRASAHGNLDCAVCHPDIAPESETTPHPDPARLTEDSLALYDYQRCASCHPEEYAAYEQGVHATARSQPEEAPAVPAPTCGHCHNAHYVTVTTRSQVLEAVGPVCGDCHPDALETYTHDYHGKAVLLGRENAATCADCHGAHNVLALKTPAEEAQACRRCHPRAEISLTGYYVHARETLQAAPEDPNRQAFALLFWVQLFFIALTASVLAVFYAHTGLWFLRSLHERLRRPAGHAAERAETGPEYWRFNIYHRLVHLLVLTSFFGSTISGMPLKYPTTRWAQWFTRLQGGVEVMGIIHRISAVVIALWCLMHLAYIVHYVFVQKRKPWGPDTPVPTIKDFRDIWQNFLYFIGKGSRPLFDRFAYFEKFDYWAVFWGVPVIGLSGLVLWFPEFFSRFLPGIVINIAHIMHSDEALLAVGFIYIVHLFNTHIRFDKFPLNKVIFTGKVSEEELRHERPLEWERIEADSRRAEEMRVR